MRKLKMLAVASILAFGSTMAIAASAPDNMAHGMGAGGEHAGKHTMMGKHPKGKPMKHSMGMFSDVNLTPEQRQKIQVIYYEGQAKLASMPLPTHSDMNAFHDIIAADKFDDAKLRAQLETKSKAQIERRVEMAKIHYNMYQVLTAEQKAQLKAHHDAKANSSMNHKAGHNAPCPMMG